MRIEIVGVEPRADGDAIVEVSSAVGRFVARWHGAAPAVADARHVELALDHRFTWGVDAVAVAARAHAIAPGADGGVVLWATVEQLDDDGFVGLRLGPSLVMTEADGDPPPLGATVRLAAPSVTLFDTDL